MMARRSDSLIAAQRAISSMVRPQPTHRPVSLSSRQILTHGVSKGGLCRLMVPETYCRRCCDYEQRSSRKPENQNGAQLRPSRLSGLGRAPMRLRAISDAPGSGAPGGARPLRLDLAGLGDPGQGLHHPLAREGDDDLGAVAELALQLEGSVMQLGQALGDGKAEPGAAFGRLMGERALAEALQHPRDLVLGDAGAGVLHA